MAEARKAPARKPRAKKEPVDKAPAPVEEPKDEAPAASDEEQVEAQDAAADAEPEPVKTEAKDNPAENEVRAAVAAARAASGAELSGSEVVVPEPATYEADDGEDEKRRG